MFNDASWIFQSPTLVAEIEKRERRLDQISEDLLSTDAKGLEARFAEVEQFVLTRLRDVQLLLTGDVSRAKVELAKHCTEITLTAARETYTLSGDWDLLGLRSDGAG